MEFQRERVYTSLNADELRAGDKVITARCMADLKTWVEADAEPNIIEMIQDETNTDRFTCKCHGSNKTYDTSLAYLVERAENCTNCGSHEVCGYVQNVSKFACLNRCENYKPKTEQKAENYGDFNCEAVREAYNEKHYRPFKDTDELIKVWLEKGGKWQKRELTMPLIWVTSGRDIPDDKGFLITGYDTDNVIIYKDAYCMEELFDKFTFLDGSVCGVEE